MLAQQTESINLPADLLDYRAFVIGLPTALRLLLFGVAPGASTFRCPTNGRIYADDHAQRHGRLIWSTCYWCDTHGRVRGQDKDFNAADGQLHNNPIVEVSDE